MKRLISILCLCFLSAIAAFCADFYVSTAGSDSNPGTQAQPFATIQHAIDVCPATPTFSTVHLDASTWNESPSITSKNITLIGDFNGPHGVGGRTVSVVNGTITVTSGAYQAINLIKFLTARKCSISVSMPSTIDSCDLTYSTSDGISFLSFSPVGQVTVTNCLIAYCSGNGVKNSNGMQSNGINLNNCTIHDCGGDGVNLQISPSIINGNDIYNNNSNGLELSNDDSLIYDNKIEDNQSYGIYIVNNSHSDLGGGAYSSPGNNTISGNGTYEIYNASPNNIYAKYNHWDDQSEGQMAGGYYNTVNVTLIWDKWEDTSKGYIMWSEPGPTKAAAPSLGMLKATFYPSSNRVSQTKAR